MGWKDLLDCGARPDASEALVRTDGILADGIVWTGIRQALVDVCE